MYEGSSAWTRRVVLHMASDRATWFEPQSPLAAPRPRRSSSGSPPAPRAVAARHGPTGGRTPTSAPGCPGRGAPRPGRRCSSPSPGPRRRTTGSRGSARSRRRRAGTALASTRRGDPPDRSCSRPCSRRAAPPRRRPRGSRKAVGSSSTRVSLSSTTRSSCAVVRSTCAAANDPVGGPVLEALGVQDLVRVRDAQLAEALTHRAAHAEPGARREGVDGALREGPAEPANALEQEQGLALEHAGLDAGDEGEVWRSGHRRSR